MRRITLLALFVAAWAVPSSAAVGPIDVKRGGEYVRGDWKYVLRITAPRTRSEGRVGSLFHGGKPVGEPQVNDHHRTPWGLMYWHGKGARPWGWHGWAPQLKGGAKRGKLLPAPGGAGKDLLLGDADNGKTTTARLGQLIVVQLTGNPTTGYSWQIRQIAGDAVRKVPFGKSDYQYVRRATPQPMVGSGGAFRFRFEAVRVGQSTVSLGYARPWEKGKAPIKKFDVTIDVKRSGGPGGGQVAAKRARALKGSSELFTMHLHYVGKDVGDKGGGSLLLVGRKPKAALPGAGRPTAAVLHITGRQVAKIVDHLVDSGFLAKAPDAMRDPIPLAQSPCYLLRVTGGPKDAMMDLRGNLGWGKELQASLSALCTVLMGDPAEALRKIIARVKTAR